MKKVNKSYLITIAIVIIIAIIAITALTKEIPTTTQEIAKCIGEKATLYVQLGCSHCETQEKMFGENLQYLNRVDCFYEVEKCQDISGTPTWVIKGKEYTRVQSIEKLKELTNC